MTHTRPVAPLLLGFAMVALAALPATDRLAPRLIAAAEAVRKWWRS